MKRFAQRSHVAEVLGVTRLDTVIANFPDADSARKAPSLELDKGAMSALTR